MKYHIVQVNEKIQDISRKYNVPVEEIIKLNRHVNNIDYIVPGMKLRLPILTEPVNEEIKNHFLDIEKYYPKLDDFKEVEIKEKQEEKEHEEVKKTEVKQTPSYVKPNPYYYQPQYQYYQSYHQQPYYAYNPSMYYVNRNVLNTLQPLNYNQVNTNQDLTISPIKEKAKEIKYDSKNEKAAFCDPILLNKLPKVEISHNDFPSLFQQPLYQPPYPCCEEIRDIEKKEAKEEKDVKEEVVNEEVKEIKVDLREFVKKNTKIRKKDSLELL